MAVVKVPFNSIEEAVKQLGKEETWSCLETGYKNKQYRKQQNAKNQMILEIAKTDPRFKDQIVTEAKKRTA